jgi:hypothetical protein
MLTAQSLHPGAQLIYQYLDRDRRAAAIVSAWCPRFDIKELPETHPWWSLVWDGAQ